MVPLLLTLTFIPTWISYCAHCKKWDEITYALLNSNGATVELWEWICNFGTLVIWVISASRNDVKCQWRYCSLALTRRIIISVSSNDFSTEGLMSALYLPHISLWVSFLGLICAYNCFIIISLSSYLQYLSSR